MSPGSPQFSFCGKKPPGRAGTEIKGGVLVNAYPVETQKNNPIYKYDIRILAHFPKGKAKEITKQICEDYSELVRKELLSRILKRLVNEEKEFFTGELLHDRAACAYSLTKLDIPNKENGVVFEKPGDYVPKIGSNDAEKIVITIKECKDSFQANTNSLDNVFKEFANIAVATEAYLNPEAFTIYGNNVFITNPVSAGFNDGDAPQLPGMAVALPVIKKSVKIVEGPTAGKQRAVLIVDISKSPMHLPGKLLQKVQAIVSEDRRGKNLNMEHHLKSQKIIKALKMLEVVPFYRTDARPIIIKAFADSAAREMIPDLKMTVQQYYKQKLKIVLKYPSYPTIRDARGNCYPIEVLEVLNMQRVRKSQELPSQTEKIIRASAILPSIRKQQTEKAFNALQLENSGIMNEVGLVVHNEMIKLPARCLPHPRIVYGMKKTEDVSFGSWRLKNNVTFFGPATVSVWAVWGNCEDRNLATLGAFCDQLVSRAAYRGMKLAAPQKIQVDSRNLAAEFAKASAAGITFILMVSEDYDEAHKELKYLEIKHKIATQEVCISVARKAVERRQVVTFDNIVMKMNIKNKGFNHDVMFPSAPVNALLNNTNRLIIGIDMSHPAPGVIRDQSASVIGWAANCLHHPTMYSGNFVYCEPRQTEPDLTPVFKQVIGRLLKYRKVNITNIDIFISGISDGQLTRHSCNAVEQCLEVCRVVNFTPQVTLIAISMEHAERFYNVRIEGDRAGKQNVQPGMVVDKQIVHPSHTQFFLASHAPVQGTSSVPKYTVCIDMQNRSLDDIEMQVYGLCHLHQYSLSTTKCPTPLYVASDYAQRGADVLPFIVKNELPDGEWSFETLNQCTYQRTILDNTRAA